MLTHASEQRTGISALRICATHLLPLHEEPIGNRVNGRRSGRLGVDSAKRENKDDLAAKKLADVTKRNGRVAARGDDRVWPEFQNDRHGKKPIDDEVLPKDPISIPAVGAHEGTGPPLQQLAREKSPPFDLIFIGRQTA